MDWISDVHPLAKDFGISGKNPGHFHSDFFQYKTSYEKEGLGQLDNAEIYSHVDHTMLKAYAAWTDIEKVCGEAIKFHMASVCIPPAYVKRVREAYHTIRICTVIGFPLGYTSEEAKEYETKVAIKEGADEIDAVINIGDVKNGNFDKVLSELKKIRDTAKDKILKVIIETCYLTEKEKRILCHIVTEAKADYIKTSTGFGSKGALLEDIFLFKEEIGPWVKIKAAGGMRSREEFIAFLQAGCDRLGTSSAVKILEGWS